MNIQDIILGFLMEGPLSGYDLKGKFEESAKHFFDASFGAIYPALKRLEKDGLIQKEVIQQAGKPNKNLYAITAEGEAAFQAYLESPVAPTLMRSDFLMRLFFGQYSSRERILQWFRQEREETQQTLEELLGTKESIKQKGVRLNPYQYKTLLYGIVQNQMMLDLLEKEIRELEE